MGQTEPMESMRWTNKGQPQTLQIAVFLLYAGAVFGLLFGENRDWYQLAIFQGIDNVSAARNLGRLIWLLAIAAAVAGGVGIANEKKWGYNLALAAAIAPLVARSVVLAFLQISPFDSGILSLMFDIALMALLVHPQSRDYQRIWFK